MMAEAKYLDIANELAEQIRRGGLAAGQQLPTHRELADEFDVARATVARALRHLRSQGLIESRERRGAFVTDGLLQTGGAAGRYARGRAADDLFAGDRETCETLDAGTATPPARVADALDLEDGAEAIWRQRLIQDAGTPVNWHTSWWSGALLDACPELAVKGRMEQGTTGYIEAETGRRIVRGADRVQARGATEDEAEHLDLQPGDPVLEVEHRTWDENGDPVEICLAVNRPHRWREDQDYEL